MAVFKRKIYAKFLQWKSESQGRSALLVEGARRVGKSTIIEEFAKREYASYIMIDFALASRQTRGLFDDMSDLNYFFLQLQLLYHVDLAERRSLIVFDEVQLCPMARQAIKALVKDGRYDYIETGSLISIKKNVKDILIPSEEERVAMHPMDYEEFLWAIGDEATPGLLRALAERRRPAGEQLHRKLMRDFRLYMLVGGMPQAVAEYIESNNFRRVDAVKRNILKLYDDDFRKLDATGRISMLYGAIPAELAKNSSRYQVSSVLSNKRAEQILELLAELEDSKTVLVAYHANDPNAGMSATKDLERFKIYAADTGLFATLAFKDKDFTENIIYEKLLTDTLPANLGCMYENIAAQALAALGNELFYYSFKDEESGKRYEVDFLLAKKSKLCPIEVKSSGYKTHASLDKFAAKFSARILEKYMVCTKDFQKDGDATILPVYLLPFGGV